MLGAALALGAVLVWLASGLRVVRAEHRAVIERFGRYRRTAEPGLTLTLRFLDVVQVVDLREVVQDVTVDAMTADDVHLTFEIAVFHACTDARRYVYDITDFPVALARLVETYLRGLVREQPLEGVLAGIDHVGEVLLRSVAEVAETWGACVTRLDLVRVELPRELSEALAARAAAEQRTEARLAEERAAILADALRTEAEHQARLRRAEIRQTLLLMEAEREAEALRMAVDAERYRQETLARAQADAIRIVSVAVPPPALGPVAPEEVPEEIQAGPHERPSRPAEGRRPGAA
jgi:regulator of protease activity HflC (stomatin/prohibitin superfamily)